jgi:methionyl aminopeptidase
MLHDRGMGIVLRSEQELIEIRGAGAVVAAALDAVEAACVPGVSTAELERIAARELQRGRARSAFLGYAPGGAPPYPAVLCTSVNGVVVHGIPSERTRLVEGDVIGIDFACEKNGWCADGARTIAVGVISAPARGLLDATREALARAIEQAVAGARMGDLGAAVEGLAAARGFGVLRDFVGHGIGRRMHEPPSVPNHGRPGTGLRLKPGLVIAIEPMLTAGSPEVVLGDDGWTVSTKDGGLAAHFEHTIAITRDGPRVLTVA